MSTELINHTWRFVAIIDGFKTGKLPTELLSYQNERYYHWLGGHRLVEIAIIKIPQDRCDATASLIAYNLQPHGFYAHAVCGQRLLIIFPGRVELFDICDKHKIERMRQYGQTIGISERQMPFEFLIKEDHPHGHEDITEKYKFRIFSPSTEDDPNLLLVSSKARLCGRVMAIKDNRIDFLTNSHYVPICLPKGPYPQIGDLIGIEGKIQLDNNQRKVVVVRKWTVFTICTSPEEWRSIDGTREIAIAKDKALRNALKVRADVLKILRQTMDRRGFLEVETNMLLKVRDIAPVPHLSVLSRFDENGPKQVLRICPENQLKRLIVAGFNRVYEIGRSFRDEQATANHLQEFTSLECYIAWAGYQEIMKLCEHLIETVFKTVGYHNDGIADVESRSWQRITFRDAAIKYTGIDPDAYQDTDSLGKALSAAGISIDGCNHRRHLLDRLVDIAIEPNLINPTFLIDQPMETICVAKCHDDNPRLLERFEAYIDGIEIAHGFSELTNSSEQRTRMLTLLSEKMADGEREHPIDEDFLKALELGLPPTAGLGIGVDRLVMIATGEPIHRTVSFTAFNMEEKK